VKYGETSTQQRASKPARLCCKSGAIGLLCSSLPIAADPLTPKGKFTTARQAVWPAEVFA